VFEPSIKPANDIKDYRILLLDGHSTHLENYKFINHAINYNMHRICLPSHATHVLQPLDVSIFSLLHIYYKQELEDHVWQLGPYDKIKKDDVFQRFQRALMKTFIESNITSAGRVLGIPRKPTHKAHAQTPAYQSVKIQLKEIHLGLA